MGGLAILVVTFMSDDFSDLLQYRIFYNDTPIFTMAKRESRTKS